MSSRADAKQCAFMHQNNAKFVFLISSSIFLISTRKKYNFALSESILHIWRQEDSSKIKKEKNSKEKNFCLQGVISCNFVFQEKTFSGSLLLLLIE